ncbi:MAG TPA: hypothetical protein IGS40_12470 [Trichormus sp. M33_DOE_039]|nr:hypothetical protein [Trichormus sp. M33_DOE_039]
MLPQKLNRQRLDSLEEILEIEYEKLGYFQKEIATTANATVKFELKQRIKREIIPDIRSHECEYGELLDQEADTTVISNVDAEHTLADVVQAVENLEVQRSESYPEELLRLLREIREKLDEPGKTAAAKLKVVLPIVPLLASYELEMDTEAMMSRAWQQVKFLFTR